MARYLISAVLAICTLAASANEIPNPLIDYAGFQQQVSEVGLLRAERRITEGQFIRMAADPRTIVLDARSAEKFALLHVKGARNLSLPDMTEEDLAKVIPSKSTRILIYCNNNFLNEPDAFRSKNLRASLNVYTFNVLHSYGYTNVYELGPLLDIEKTRIPFEGERARKATLVGER